MRTSYFLRWIGCLSVIVLLSTLGATMPALGGPRRTKVPAILGNLTTPAETGPDTTLESVLPADGLQLYFEVHGEGLSQLAKLAATITGSSRDAGQANGLSIKDLSGFALTHLAVLSRSRVALVTYTGEGFAILIETSNPEEATHTGKDLAEALRRAGSKSSNGGLPKTTDQVASEEPVQRKIDFVARGRVCIAGTREAIEKITGSGALPKLADDAEFLKSRSRFAADPFFGYLATTLSGVPAPPANEEAAKNYMEGWMFAQRSLPHSFTFGGSIEGDTAAFHAVLGKPQSKTGLYSALFSSVKAAEPSAPSFASRDTDVFVDLMIDWQNLYQALAPLAGAIAGAGGAPDGAASLQSALEQKIGFSIKDDLLPTLGSELAIAIHFPSAPAQQAKASAPETLTRPPSPAFYVIVSLKDKPRFEAMLAKLARTIGGAAAGQASITSSAYRGVTIKSIKGFSYVITEGFFVGSAGQANLKKLLDERAAGRTLASASEYRSVIGAPGKSLVQVFLSGSASARFLDKQSSHGLGKPASGLSFVMSEVPDGLALNVRIPAALAATALSSAMNSKGGVFGIGPSAETAARSNRTVNGKPVPILTSDEVPRRP